MTRSSDALGKWRDVDAEGAGVSQCNNDLPSAYLLHSHGKWSIEIDGLPIKNGDFPWLC